MNTKFNTNRLSHSPSPYLRQHRTNPVWWQEWNAEVLEYARRECRPLFVSAGYATCHWCHVMAMQTFSHPGCANLLNEHFVAIKIDREERPDIDQRLMQILIAYQGSGGWPLNVFFDPDLNPLYALTFSAPTATFGMPPFQDIIAKVLAHWKNSAYQPVSVKSSKSLHIVPDTSDSGLTQIQRLNHTLYHDFDPQHGGFRGNHKFPPHCVLLYLIYCQSMSPHTTPAQMIHTTLKAMAQRGLYDHVGGGVFRYCTDSTWHIPHYEKMLYDQAMALWEYSTAYHLSKDPWYQYIARDIYQCIVRDFYHDGMYIAGHDADTNHQEGGTYLWDINTLQLSAAQRHLLAASFDLESGTTKEGTHLIRKLPHLPTPELKELLNLLHTIRSRRPQPAQDTTIITSWNALLGIALIMAARYAGIDEASRQANALWNALIGRHFRDDLVHNLVHSSVAGTTQAQGMLEDYASLLIFGSMLKEETYPRTKTNPETPVQPDTLAKLYQHLVAFRGPTDTTNASTWYASQYTEMGAIEAENIDSPIPSAFSLAQMALARYAWGRSTTISQLPYANPQMHPFYNLAALASGGYFCIIKNPALQNWHTLPLHVWQYRSTRPLYCYKGVCAPGVPSL